VAPAAWRGGLDPVTSAVEDPWTWTPSIYGPVATQVQALASRLGGDNLRTTVWAWQVLCLVAWLLVAVLLHRASRRDEPGAETVAGQRVVTRRGGTSAADRAAWLWLLNPVLLGVLLVGAHVDLLGAALALTAIVLAARHPGPAGLALGLAVGIKVTFVLVGPALLWALWRRQRRTGRRGWVAALAGLAGTAVVLVPAYALAGPHALDQLLHARQYVSLATPWRPLVDWATGPFDHDQVRDVAVVAAPVVVLLVAVGVAMAVRRSGGSPVAPRGDDDAATTRDAALATVVLATAYLLGAPYSLPWYDAVAWAPLGLAAAGVLDAVLVVRLVTVAVAYVPGRVLGMSERVREVTLGYRSDVAPWIGWALLVAVAWLAVRSRHDPRQGASRTG
jgi:hypothetical protein